MFDRESAQRSSAFFRLMIYARKQGSGGKPALFLQKEFINRDDYRLFLVQEVFLRYVACVEYVCLQPLVHIYYYEIL